MQNLKNTFMKKISYFHLILIVMVTLTSCSSTKNITMFQDSREGLNNYNILNKAPEHKIKPYDNLYLSILTLDQEVNKLFNPSLAGDGYASGTQQMFGDKTSKYINGYLVSADSTITMPILGKLNLVGLNLEEAEERVRARAEEYLKEPTVHVKFLNFKVNISGEINNPGIYYNYEGSLNILDAVSEASGITEYADLKNVIVKRQNGEKIYGHKLDLTDNSVYASDIFYLQPNDLVYIPPTNLKRRRENSDAYSKLLSTLSVLLVAVSLIVN